MRRARTLRRFVIAVALAAGSAVAAAGPMTVSSSSFEDGATIPTLHAADCECGGQNVAPAIAWGGLPPAAKSVVIVMTESNGADGPGVVHWLAYGVAAERGELRPGEGGRDDVGVVVGRGSSGTAAYRGMCPPVGDRAHHYVLTVIATDLPTTALGPGLSRDHLFRSLEGHALAAQGIVGRYAR